MELIGVMDGTGARVEGSTHTMATWVCDVH